MKIVFVSHSFYNPYFVVGSHQLARQLARRGHTVWHISAIPFFHLLNPFRRDYKLRVQRFFRGTISRENNLKEAVIRPLLPWQITRKFAKLGNFFLKFSGIGMLIRANPELHDVDYLIVDEPRLNRIEAYIHAKSIYYRPTDFYADTKHDESIQGAEVTILAGCRGLIATSEPILRHMVSLRPTIPNLLLTNGVDPDDFSSTPDEPDVLRGIAHPRAIYVGALDERFDIELIQYLSQRFPAVNFVIVGDGSRHDEVCAIAGGNIHVIGLIPHSQLNAYLRHCDVGLLPLVKSRSNDGRSPLKIYEYGMSGLPVLASHTPELDRRNEKFIELYTSHAEASERLQDILSAVRDRGTIAEQCAEHSWSRKASLLESFIAQNAMTNGAAA